MFCKISRLLKVTMTIAFCSLLFSKRSLGNWRGQRTFPGLLFFEFQQNNCESKLNPSLVLTPVEFDSLEKAILMNGQSLHEFFSKITRQISSGEGVWFRGMSLSTSELEALLSGGLKFESSELQTFRGMHFTDQPSVAVAYSFYNLSSEKHHAVLIAAELNTNDDSSHNLRWQEPIPPKHIITVWVFDKNRAALVAIKTAPKNR